MDLSRRSLNATSPSTGGSASGPYESSTPHGSPAANIRTNLTAFATPVTHNSERFPSPGPPMAVSGYGATYPYGSATGAGGPGGVMNQDHSYMHGESSVSSMPGLSPPHSSSSAAAVFSAQKRAYRQRRKDPSCDACRERKVKCDATDTSSCSECSSRGVKCQFTKETNRRMSSIKQVQDLEKQLTLAKQQISQLRGMIPAGSANDLDPESTSVPSLQVIEQTTEERRQALPMIEGLDEIQRNVRDYSRGIFDPPNPYRQAPPQPLFPHTTYALPAKHVADRLISHYHGSVHVYAPLLNWPTFSQEYEALYQTGSFRESRHTWVALFYAVLACGTLMDPQPNGSAQEAEGARYMDACLRSIDTWSDALTIDTARVALLMSIYFMEVNLRTPAWVWLGAAVHVAQDIGLHDDHGSYTAFELEMRRRVWWSVYNWDRIVSLELGRPLLINDDDCDVHEPTPVEDDCIRPSGIVIPPPGQNRPNGLVAVIPIARMTAQLKKSLKVRVVAPATLSTYDEHFKTIMASLPEPFPIHSQAYLDPRFLSACCSMQATRLFLYRHNLTSAARRYDRQNALDRCVSVAKDTAYYIERTLQSGQGSNATSSYYSPTHMASWAARLRTMSPAFLCTHLWRCTLVLCLRLECAAALTLVQASAAIGDLRKVNIACGRNLAFFLDKLLQRLRAGANVQTLDDDEELMAYASGDMQRSNVEAWIWTGSERHGSGLPGMDHESGRALAEPPPSLHSKPRDNRHAGHLSEREMQEWGGWEQVQRVLQQLLHDHQQVQQQHNQHQRLSNGPVPSSLPASSHHYPSSSSGGFMTVKHDRQNSHGQNLAPTSSSSGRTQSSVSPAPSNTNGGSNTTASNRISIRDIM